MEADVLGLTATSQHHHHHSMGSVCGQPNASTATGGEQKFTWEGITGWDDGMLGSQTKRSSWESDPNLQKTTIYVIFLSKNVGEGKNSRGRGGRGSQEEVWGKDWTQIHDQGTEVVSASGDCHEKVLTESLQWQVHGINTLHLGGRKASPCLPAHIYRPNCCPTTNQETRWGNIHQALAGGRWWIYIWIVWAKIKWEEGVKHRSLLEDWKSALSPIWTMTELVTRFFLYNEMMFLLGNWERREWLKKCKKCKPTNQPPTRERLTTIRHIPSEYPSINHQNHISSVKGNVKSQIATMGKRESGGRVGCHCFVCEEGVVLVYPKVNCLSQNTHHCQIKKASPGKVCGLSRGGGR